MFTGIVEATGTVKDIIKEGTNKTFVIEAGMAIRTGSQPKRFP